MVNRRAILDLQNKPRWSAAIHHLGILFFSIRISHAAGVHGRRHGHHDLALRDCNFTAGVHQGIEAHLVLGIAQQFFHVRAQLEIRDQAGAGLLRNRHRLAHMIEMTVRDQNVIDLLDPRHRILAVFRLGVHRILEPWIDQQHDAVRRHNFKGCVAMPYKRRVSKTGGCGRQDKDYRSHVSFDLLFHLTPPLDLTAI